MIMTSIAFGGAGAEGLSGLSVKIASAWWTEFVSQ
jgi:hypothetical protein